MPSEPSNKTSLIKKFLHDVVCDQGHTHFKKGQFLIVVVTIISVLSSILASVPALDAFDKVFSILETICATFFMAEFAIRLWVSDDRKNYVTSFWGFVDMLSFVPIVVSALPLPSAMVAQQLKVLLVVRTLRIAKVTRAYIEGLRASSGPEVSQDLNVKVYFLALFSAAIANGAVMYALESEQAHYATMPRAILEVMKTFMGTAPWPTKTIWGELFLVVVRFEALCLLGLLIEVMGAFMRGLLFGGIESSAKPVVQPAPQDEK
jgi:voltage-gated potassium channel